jgi:hypothetical protein
MNYENISTQAGDVIRYRAKKAGYAIFSSLPFNFIATNHITIQLNNDTLTQIPVNKGEEIRATLPLELVKFIPYEEVE